MCAEGEPPQDGITDARPRRRLARSARAGLPSGGRCAIADCSYDGDALRHGRTRPLLSLRHRAVVRDAGSQRRDDRLADRPRRGAQPPQIPGSGQHHRSTSNIRRGPERAIVTSRRAGLRDRSRASRPPSTISSPRAATRSCWTSASCLDGLDPTCLLVQLTSRTTPPVQLIDGAAPMARLFDFIGLRPPRLPFIRAGQVARYRAGPSDQPKGQRVAAAGELEPPVHVATCRGRSRGEAAASTVAGPQNG